MRLDDIPLFAMLKGRMNYLGARQRVIAENVANADTPGFVPTDIKPQSFEAMVRAGQGGRSAPAGSLAVTSPRHIQREGPAAAAGLRPDRTPDSETRLDGNAVVLEEQMLKMAESRMAYDAAISFYQKSMNMLRIAAKPPR